MLTRSYGVLKRWKTGSAAGLAAALFLFSSLSGVGAAPAQASPWDEVLVFGDSLSDVGNVRQRSSEFLFGLFTTPDDRYFQGRFSNGPVWVESVGNELGLDASTRSYSANGLNFAHGGATTFGGTANFGIIRNLGRQVDTYLIDEGRTPDADSLVVVWAGGNDFLDGGTDTVGPANRIVAQMQRLYDAGARHFLAPNLPPLGETPRFAGDETAKAQNNALSAGHNASLSAALSAFAQQPGAVVFELDIAGIFADLLADPSAFGVTNTADQGIDLANPADAGTYLFWDDVHPTALGHQLISEVAIDLIRLDADANYDGVVDLLDFDLLAQGFGGATALGIDGGDFNADGVVDLLDFDTLAQLFGQSFAGSVTAATVPEPGAAAFLVCGAAWLGRRRSRQGDKLPA
ncbi:MAG: SGNH/GDSL hydrolase family protein [Planctomycetota bacterium]